MLIRQEQIDNATLRHRLHGTSRKIYLFCRSIKSIQEIQTEFPQIMKTTLLTFLNDLAAKKILFTEDDLFLALAIKP